MGAQAPEDQHPTLSSGVRSPMAPVELVSQQKLVGRWLTWLDEQVALQQLAELTSDGYRTKIRYWLDYLELVARTDRPTPATVQAYVASVIAGEHEPATVNAYLNAVKSFYRWCETGDLYPAIARSIKAVRERRDGPLPALTHDQVVDLVDRIPEDTLVNLRDRAMIALIYATAFRTISVVRSNIGDVDFDGCSMSHQAKGHITNDGKAALPRSVVELLERYLEARRAKLGIANPEGPEPLFIALDRHCSGQRISGKTIRGRVLHYMELSGHAKRRGGKLVNPGVFSTHSLRRSAAVTTADAVGLDVAQGLLGHASIETTKKAYARSALDRRLRENADRLDPLKRS